MQPESLPRVAVVTGAASGIGKALALEAARRGMDVALADTSGDGLREVCRESRKYGISVASEVLDVRSANAVDSFADKVFKSHIHVAFVFANAGIVRAGATSRPVLEDWDLVIDVNLRGTIHTMAGFIPRLIAQGLPAQFVFTASHASLLAIPSLGIYSATKHAVWALAESLQYELEEAAGHVGVSIICPGGIRTNIIDAAAKRVIRGNITSERDAALDAAKMAPDQLAKQVFDALQARPFWIHSHPEVLSAVERRFAAVLASETTD